MSAALQDAKSISTLEIRAVVQDVRVASEWMAHFAELHSVPADQINRLDLCLNEALANVISYGSEQAAAQPVQLQIAIACEGSGGQASVTVIDAGPEFNVADAPISARPHSLAEAEPGGLGLLMIRSFSDSLSYQRAQGLNALTFCVRWNRSLD